MRILIAQAVQADRPDRDGKTVRVDTGGYWLWRLVELRYVLDLIYDHDLLMRDKISLRVAQDVADWFRERAYYLLSVSVRAVLMAADMRRLHAESWRRKLERDIRAEPVADPRDVPERRLIVPRSQRPGYVPPVASAHTLQRREQREAAKRPDAQSKKDALQVFRTLGR